jgi:hypothetical protein
VLEAYMSDETQKRLFALADNKIALNAEWDVDMLKVEFSALSALELDVDLETTGFATAEIDLLIDGPTKPSNTDPSDIIPELESTAVSKLGDGCSGRTSWFAEMHVMARSTRT